MPPKATLRIMAETLAARGWKHDQIADHIGMNAEYARKVVNRVNRNEGVDPTRPAAGDHRKHLQTLYDANGYGFSWYPPSIMKRVYLLEKAPRSLLRFGSIA